MPNYSNKKPKKPEAKMLTVEAVICIPDQQGHLSDGWVDSIRAEFSDARIFTLPRFAEKLGIEPTKDLRLGDNDWLQHLLRVFNVPTFVIRHGLKIPPHLLKRLELLLEEDQLPNILAFCNNYSEHVNPLNQLEGNFNGEGLDSILWNTSEVKFNPIAPHLETHLGAALLTPKINTTQTDGRCPISLSDLFFFHDPTKCLSSNAELDELTSKALGMARARVIELSEKGYESLPYFGLDGRAVTLHITHNWGGGITRWIRDIHAHDKKNHHLVLATHAPGNSKQYGQSLVLNADGPQKAPIQEFLVDPIISETAIEHSGYIAFLQWVITRYGIGRILVSSLIGHSLDCLRQKLPTAQILHDFYPASPVFDIDPTQHLSKTGSLNLKALLRRSRDKFKFLENDTTYWSNLRSQWQSTIQEQSVKLIAPSQHVSDRWQTLFHDNLPRIDVLPHGFQPPKNWRPLVRNDSGEDQSVYKLHLVIIGRTSAGKGLHYLTQMAGQFKRQVKYTVVGGGVDALQLLGCSNIDVTFDYDNDGLPGILERLKPDAALFLSTVPETWNYVLSEVIALGLPVIAPRLGSFSERIKHKKSGLLFEPSMRGLKTVIASILTGKSELISPIGKFDEPNMKVAIGSYRRVLPPIKPKTQLESKPFQPTRAYYYEKDKSRTAEQELTRRKHEIYDIRSKITQQANLLSRLDRVIKTRSTWAQELDREVRKLVRRSADLEQDTQERTHWALRLQKELDERTQWAQSLEKDNQERTDWALRLQKELDERTQWAQSLEGDLRARTEWAQSLEKENNEKTNWALQLYKELEDRTKWAQTLDRELAQRTEWALNLGKALEKTNKVLQETETINRELSTYGDLLAQQNQYINALKSLIVATEAERDEARQAHQELYGDLLLTQQQLSKLEQQTELIVKSRSWRITRPLRLLVRVMSAAHHRRSWHPGNWLRQSRRLSHAVSTYGWRATLDAIQYHRPSTGPMSTDAFEATPPHDQEPLKPIFFSTNSASSKIDVSIIIPVHNNVSYTARCLESIHEHQEQQYDIEIIVVNDSSTDLTESYLAQCQGIHVITNKTNLGFIGSCNKGAKKASGESLVFLNNDTQVTHNWLSSLIEPFSRQDTGIVGARLVYPTGELQEAGGIIFRDGSGWNYGRMGPVNSSRVQFLCEADYVSGACLAIKTQVFESLNGFDTYYSPAYYEDTDLCFRVRKLGLKVIYQPKSIIVHFEGVSSGTSETSGTKRFQAINRDKFKARWADTLEQHPEPVSGPEETVLIEKARHHRAKGHVLVVDAVTPQPDQDSGSVRMLAILELLIELGYRVSFMPLNLAWDGPYSEALQNTGIEVIHHPETTSPQQWLKTYGALLDWVIGSRYYVLEELVTHLENYAPQASIIFDTVDLHFLREQRKSELEGDERVAKVANNTKAKELSLIRHSDATLVVSPVEKDLLEDLVPGANIQILSNIHTAQTETRPFGERSGLLFVGGYQHPPNIDAARWIIDEILPELLKHEPTLELHLIGSKMPEWLKSTRMPGLRNLGFVQDITPYLQKSRIALAPLRYGAGVKGKVNQAMAFGIPVVATTCAAEGMYVEDGVDILIADSTEKFVEQIIRLYNDPILWENLSLNGKANVNTHFSRKAAQQVLTNILSTPSDY